MSYILRVSTITIYERDGTSGGVRVTLVFHGGARGTARHRVYRDSEGRRSRWGRRGKIISADDGGGEREKKKKEPK